jgi:hypothetical protein
MTPQQEEIGHKLLGALKGKSDDYVADVVAVSLAYLAARLGHGAFDSYGEHRQPPKLRDLL